MVEVGHNKTGQHNYFSGIPDRLIMGEVRRCVLVFLVVVTCSSCGLGGGRVVVYGICVATGGVITPEKNGAGFLLGALYGRVYME